MDNNTKFQLLMSIPEDIYDINKSKDKMNRKKFLKLFGLGVGAVMIAPALIAKENNKVKFKTYTMPNGVNLVLAIDKAYDNPYYFNKRRFVIKVGEQGWKDWNKALKEAAEYYGKG